MLLAVLVASLASATPAPVASAPPGLEPLRRAYGAAVGRAALWRRAREREDAAPFGHLAASQVGYAPRMQKRFTSPRPFTSFEVVREADGTVAYRGGLPVRTVATNLLGAIRTVWIGDFSPLTEPGRYRVVLDGGPESHPFSIGAGVFDPAVRAVQRWFYYQRAFTAVEAPWAEGPWTHPSDADKAPPGVRQGWHDAGDFSIYNAPLATALFWMLSAYDDFAPADDATHVPESGNGVPDLLDEARWGLEWLLSVQDAATGGFASTTCQDRYARYGENTHASVPPYRAGEVGTLATARAVGTLAHAAAVFEPWDPAFAARCLAAARRGYGYLEARPDEASDGPSCPAYRRDGDPEVGRHVRMYAAAGMLRATGERRFAVDFERTSVASWADPDYHHVAAFAARLYLRARAGDPARKRALRERFRALAGEVRTAADAHPFDLAARYQWGSISAALHRTGASSAWACVDAGGRGQDCDRALAPVHYALGRNYLQLCYVSGLPGATRGVRRVFHHWLATLRAEPYVFPGALAGGPNPRPDPRDVSYPQARPRPIWGYFGDPAFPRDDATPIEARYTENDSWSTNETAADWQGAALYALHLAQWLARRADAR